MNIGELVAELGIDSSGLDRANRELKNFENSANTRFATISKYAAAAGVAMLGIATAAVKMANDFNRSMSEVATLIPGNIGRVNELKEGVQDLAISVGKSTGDMAGGLYQVISAFGDTNDTLATLEINAKAAAAGMSTTTDAINLTSAVTKGYGDVSAEAVQKAADLAFVTVKLGQTTFPELAASIGRVVPLAAQLNVKQEELFAGFATLTGVTGNAAEVSTQLAGILRAMIKPTEEMKKAVAELGAQLGLGSNATIEMVVNQIGLRDTLEGLVKQTDGTSQGMAKLFSRVEGLTALLTLTKSQADAFGTKLGAMNDRVGAGDEAFREISQGVNAFGFEMEQMKQSVIVAGQKLGDFLIPAFSSMMHVVNNAIQGIGDFIDRLVLTKKGFEDSLGPINEWGSAIERLKYAAVSLGAVLVALSPFIIASTWGAMATAVGALAAKFPLLTAAVTTLGPIIAGMEIAKLTDDMDLFGRHAAWTSNEILEYVKSLEEAADFQKIIAYEMQDAKKALDDGAISQKTYNAILKDLTDQRPGETVEQYRDRIEALIMQYDHLLKFTGPVLDEQEKLKKQNDELASSVSEVAQEFEKMSKPLSEIVKEITKFEKEGIATDKIMKVYWKDVLTAEQQQRKFGNALTESEKGYVAVAMAVGELDRRFEQLQEDLPIIQQMNEDALEKMKAYMVTTIAQWRQWNTIIADQARAGRESFYELFADLDDVGPIVSDLFDQFFELGDELHRGIITEELNRMSDSANSFGRVMSTTLTNVSQDIARKVTGWAGPFQDFASSALAAIMEGLFDPLYDELNSFGRTFSNWLRDLFGGAKVTGGGGGAGFGSLFGGIGGIGGALLGGAGIGGLAASLIPGGASTKILGGVGAGLLGGAGLMASGLIPGVGATFGGALGFLSSGAGLFGATGLLGLGALTVPVIGAVAASIPMIVKAIMGKSSEEAGAMEVTRDLKINYTKELFKEFYESLGLTEATSYNIRKDLIVSPKFLVEQAAPIAQATGKMDEFLRSLENIQTAWGTFDFRDAFEIGYATGDWTDLNAAFKEAWATAEGLKKVLPDWETSLMAPAEAVKSALDLQIEAWENFRDAVESAIPVTEDMYTTFLLTGEITDELRDEILRLGGDLSSFEALSGILEVNNSFEQLVQHFRDTGEILPDLRKMFRDFGGDLSTLDAAAELPGLHSQLDFINELIGGLESLNRQFDPVKRLLSGEFGPDVISALTAANLDPSKFTKLVDLIGMEDTFNTFKPFMDLTPELERALLRYGGTAGHTAVERYYSGFNTITQDLLNTVKSAMDRTYQTELQRALDYLGEKAGETNTSINDLSSNIEDQFEIVGGNISDAITDATTLLLAKVDEMIDVLKNPLENVATTTTVTGPESMEEAFRTLSPEEYLAYLGYNSWEDYALSRMGTGYTTPWLQHGGVVKKSGMALVDEGEIYTNREILTPMEDWFKQLSDSIVSAVRGNSSGRTVIIKDSVINGWDDLVEKVRQAGIELQDRGA